MTDYMERQKIQGFLAAALECSFYLSPTKPGLYYSELVEVGRQAGYLLGEIEDAIPSIATIYFGSPQPLFPNKGALPHWHIFMYPEEPEFRDVSAFAFLHAEFRDSGRLNGIKNIRFDRKVLVERATAKGISRIGIEAALAISLFTSHILEKDGIIMPAPGHEAFPDPHANRSTLGGRPPARHEARARAYPLVKDVIERRTDGRASSAEPLDAFADQLTVLGYGPFRLWWMQIVSEFRQASRQTSPVAVTVLAAALVEGALTFVVKHARLLDQPAFRSSDFDGNANTWKIEKLVASAATGGDAAILDQPTKHRAEGLVRTRQRIHAGRMLTEFPKGPVNLMPEEARDAETTAELVVGRVLDWLRKTPKPPT